MCNQKITKYQPRVQSRLPSLPVTSSCSSCACAIRVLQSITKSLSLYERYQPAPSHQRHDTNTHYCQPFLLLKVLPDKTSSLFILIDYFVWEIISFFHLLTSSIGFILKPHLPPFPLDVVTHSQSHWIPVIPSITVVSNLPNNSTSLTRTTSLPV